MKCASRTPPLVGGHLLTDSKGQVELCAAENVNVFPPASHRQLGIRKCVQDIRFVMWAREEIKYRCESRVLQRRAALRQRFVDMSLVQLLLAKQRWTAGREQEWE